MKLRIRGNAIRFRLQRAEVEALVLHGALQDTLRFAPDPGGQWHYGIALSDADTVGIGHGPGAMTVLLPRAIAKELAESERVGVEAEIPVAEGATLRVQIEKDYQCLVDRPGEDDRDAFPNPDSGKAC